MTAATPASTQNVTVACAQMACSWDLPANVDRAEALIRAAAARGAQIIQIQELCEAPYFCIDQAAKHFELASTLEESGTIRRFQALAKSLGVVLPVSWFERAGRAFFNSVAICWDQWFPEAARAMALLGAELLFYPSAIGTDPASGLDMRRAWQRVMQGHAVANSMPVIACNRIGTEKATTSDLELSFFGSTFIADQAGTKVQEADTASESVLVHTFDLEACRRMREYWSLFRDRRPDLYGPLLTHDGRSRGVRVARTEYSGNLVYYGPFLAPDVGPTTPLASVGSGSATPVTPKAVLAYQPNSDSLYYASAAKGYRVGGVNGAVSSLCAANLATIGISAPPGTYSSDSLWSYELGAKNTLLGGRLQINASVFVIDWTNIQQAVYLTGCGQNFVANLGKVQSHGSEVELHARPIEALQLGLSVAYVDAKYTKTVCAGPNSCTGAGAIAQPIVTEGDRLPGAPWQFLTSAEYAFPEFHDRKPYLRIDYQLSTAQTAQLPIQDPNNGVSDPTFVGLPKIGTLQMRAGARWNGFDVSLYGRNLTDAHPLIYRSRDTTASDLFFDHSLRPRTFGLTATYRY